MKPYFFSMSICHHRTLAPLGKRVGVVFAEDEDGARELAWHKFGNDTATLDWVEEITEAGFGFTVYNGHTSTPVP